MSSPYEIRTQLLNLAKQILEADFDARRTKADNDYFTKKDNDQYNVGEYPKVNCFTTEDVIAEAEKLNKFVSDKRH